jgi:hypothetical protein
MGSKWVIGVVITALAGFTAGCSEQNPGTSNGTRSESTTLAWRISVRCCASNRPLVQELNTDKLCK